MKKIILFVSALLFAFSVQSQTDDQSMIKAIFDKALKEGHSYRMLDYLSNEIGGRLSGSPQAAAAVEWSRNEMVQLGFDQVFLQEVMVPHWVRGKVEKGKIINSRKLGSVEVNICALGNSIGTGPGGIVAPLIEVKSLDELEKLGKENVEGKIVFFSRPMDPTNINTFSSYGGAVDQRGSGASEAARFGAVGAVVRSMGLNLEDYPHTGSLRYNPDYPEIPAVAISTKDAELLSGLMADDSGINFFMETHAQMLDDVLSHNVIGELSGKKNGFIAVGGHLDSWDLGDGSHDDGAGCVQSIEAIRILKELGYQPNNTLRAVMFMNEENGLRGGLKYAEIASQKKEKHIAAMESDRGGFVPRGFTMQMTDKQKAKVREWKSLLEPYGVYDFSQNGGGADIGPLASQGVALLGLLPDSQRYFNYHHTTADTFDKIEKRELELGAAAMAAMIYLIDKYGL